VPNISKRALSLPGALGRGGLSSARFRPVLIALPAVYALIRGADQAYLVRGRLLDPDVLTFQNLAAEMTPQSIFGGVREPLWPLLFVVPVRMLGANSEIAIRLIGVLGFVFMIVAFQLVVRELFGRAWSIVAALLLASSPWLIYQAARGLREETSAGLVLMFCLGLMRRPVTGHRVVLLFGLAGLTGLLRWDAMMVMLPVLALAMIILRPPPIAWTAGPALLALLVAPLLIGNYVQHGDPLYGSNILAKFFRNLEFHDQPGFVTSAEMATDSYAGPPITWTQYVFGLHSLGELFSRALHAYRGVPIESTMLALFYPHLGSRPLLVVDLHTLEMLAAWLLWFPAVIGGISLLRTRAWPIPLMLGGTILAYSPIAELIDYRLVLVVIPLLAVCVIECIRLATTYWRPAIRLVLRRT